MRETQKFQQTGRMYKRVALFPSYQGLILAWFGVNLLDTLIMCVALNMGATQVSPTYQLTRNLVAVVGAKYLAAMLIVDILTQVRRTIWLNWFIAAMLSVVSWNLVQILINA
jgi:hypothetical protein